MRESWCENGVEEKWDKRLEVGKGFCGEQGMVTPKGGGILTPSPVPQSEPGYS